MTPAGADAARFDKQRAKNVEKKCSNDDWQSPSDPDARITKMKDGSTHLAYKAENAVDLDTEAITAAEIYPADEADSATLEDTLRFQNIELTDLNLSGLADIPADLAGIVLAAPKYDLSDAELRVLERYWNQPRAAVSKLSPLLLFGGFLVHSAALGAHFFLLGYPNVKNYDGSWTEWGNMIANSIEK